MKEEIQIFRHEVFGEIRCLNDENNNPWFVGKDVTTILGYKDPSRALFDHVDEEDKTALLIQQSGSNYKTKTTLVNESGLYSLVLSSKLPQAKQFKRWVTAEVLPQIRRTGGYIPIKEEDDEKTILCKALMIYKRTAEEHAAKLEAQKPQVMFAEAVVSCDDSILIRDLAKLITQNGVNIGQNRLFCWLRTNGYIFKNENRPMQKWVEAGLFDTTINLVQTHSRSFERCTTKVTGKGQQYFVNGFVSGKFCAANDNFKK